MIVYSCKECDQIQIDYKVIPKLKCPCCGKYMDAEEEE